MPFLYCFPRASFLDFAMEAKVLVFLPKCGCEFIQTVFVEKRKVNSWLRVNVPWVCRTIKIGSLLLDVKVFKIKSAYHNKNTQFHRTFLYKPIFKGPSPTIHTIWPSSSHPVVAWDRFASTLSSSFALMLSNLCWPFELQLLDSRVASSLSIRIYVDIIIHTCWVWPSSCNSDQQKEHTQIAWTTLGNAIIVWNQARWGARKWARSAQYFFCWLLLVIGKTQHTCIMYHMI